MYINDTRENTRIIHIAQRLVKGSLSPATQGWCFYLILAMSFRNGSESWGLLDQRKWRQGECEQPCSSRSWSNFPSRRWIRVYWISCSCRLPLSSSGLHWDTLQWLFNSRGWVVTPAGTWSVLLQVHTDISGANSQEWYLKDQLPYPVLSSENHGLIIATMQGVLAGEHCGEKPSSIWL